MMVVLATSMTVTAEDWPGWRGPNRDGESPSTGLMTEWPADGPPQVWSVDGLGLGYSQPAIVDGKLYISGVIGSDLVVFCFNDADGSKVWEKKVGPGWDNEKRYPGARSTPMIDGDKLYIMSGPGVVYCLKTSDGSEIWSIDVTKDYKGKMPKWAFSESILIVGDKAIFTPGDAGGMVAVNKATGEKLWQTDKIDPAHYCAAIYVEHNGVPLIIQGLEKSIIGVNADSGEVLWTNRALPKNIANCPSPDYQDGYVFWSVGYGKGGVCLKLDDKAMAEEAWTTRDMVSQHGGYVILDNFIYGNHNQGWSCLDLKTGETQWREKGIGKGSIAYADGMLYLYDEKKGICGLAPATPEGLTIKSQFSVKGEGFSWANPVIINKRLYLRYNEFLYCFDVAAK